MSAILGKCHDLKSAYKQFARSADQGHLSIVVVWDPSTRQPRLFEATGLMFGATGSVYGFNRCSLGLQAILVKLFRIPVTVSYTHLTLPTIYSV